jgi:cytochrome b
MSPKQGRKMVRVWDLYVRLFHWSLVAAVSWAWFGAKDPDALHAVAGYTACGLLASRLIWGVVGFSYARFSSFVKRPKVVIDYLRSIARGNEARYLGHNPAGGAMIVALLTLICATCASGGLLNTDAFWGDERLQAVHQIFADGLLILVAIHIAGVLLASFHHKENLVWAMITGRKRKPTQDDIVD